MKLTPNLQRLARQAFGEMATIQHRRYGPHGEKREGYWLHNNDEVRYLAYSRQQTIDYLNQIIAEHTLHSLYQNAA
jgi:hypothetical protein